MAAPAADRNRFLIGADINPVYLTAPAYPETLAGEFHMLETEDGMKWMVLRPFQAMKSVDTR